MIAIAKITSWVALVVAISYKIWSIALILGLFALWDLIQIVRERHKVRKVMQR